jgi:long-chain acyl-CoA synthetase
VTYAELEAGSNRLAHLLRNRGLKRLDHYAIFMENNSRYLEACGAGERSGLYYACVNSYLTASELAYIVANSESRILITSVAKLDVAREVLKECPKVELCIVADGGGESERIVGLQQATAGLPKTPIRRVHRRRHAIFVGHDRPAERHTADPERYLELIEKWGVTHSPLVPTSGR